MVARDLGHNKSSVNGGSASAKAIILFEMISSQLITVDIGLLMMVGQRLMMVDQK